MQTCVDGNIIDIFGKCVFPGTVCISDGIITDIHRAGVPELAEGRFTKKSPYILPGFIDSYLNLEMTQMSPAEYARKALSQGVIGALCDSNGVTPILGKKGVEVMIKNGAQSSFYFGFAAPSTVHGSVYSLDDIESLLAMKEVTHLGAISNFPSVILHEHETEKLFALAEKYHKPVDGFAPGVTHLNLKEYCRSPISADHACHSYEDAVEKIAAGLLIQIPTRVRLDYTVMQDLFDSYAEKLMLCSDIIFGINVDRGYLNKNVAEAVCEGHDLFGVLRAACVNPVEHYKLPCGLLRKGDSADFILIDRPESCTVQKTYIKGECVYDAGSAMPVAPVKEPLPPLNNFAAEPITNADIAVSASDQRAMHSNTVPVHSTVNVIDTCDGEVNTVRMSIQLKAENGYLYSDKKQDCLKTVLYNRYGLHKPVTVFVHGFGFLRGAFAMSICHDEQHIIATGIDDSDIVLAINKVVELKGGMVLAVNGKISAAVPLDFAGLMSVETAEEFTKKSSQFFSVLRKDIGCPIAHPVRTLSYLADVDIPTIKITEKGLFNVVEQELIPLIQ